MCDALITNFHQVVGVVVVGGVVVVVVVERGVEGGV